MRDRVEAPLGEQPRHCAAVGDVEPAKPEAAVAPQHVQARLVQAEVVVVVQIIDAVHRITPLEQAQRQRVAYQAGSDGDQYNQADLL
jgi:hypothetical protein